MKTVLILTVLILASQSVWADRVFQIGDSYVSGEIKNNWTGEAGEFAQAVRYSLELGRLINESEFPDADRAKFYNQMVLRFYYQNAITFFRKKKSDNLFRMMLCHYYLQLNDEAIPSIKKSVKSLEALNKKLAASLKKEVDAFKASK